MPLSPGSRIGPYEVTGPLGAGGMGEVYRARDSRLKRDVALKVLLEDVAADPDRLARFQREAEALAAMNHPNIAAIYGLEGTALVLELVEGPTLADRIAQGKLAAEEARPLVTQLIDALEYAHEKGIVHRDLKPANVKITPEGRLKVLDFGLATAFSTEPAPSNPMTSPTLTMRATMAGVILGTAGYMAPEQARGHQVDKRADIWAFGAVVWEMLTGEQLFAGPTVSDSLAAVLTRDPDFDRIPLEFRKLVRLCLTKDAKQRLRDIGDARIALADGSAAAREPLPVAAPPQRKRRRMLWAVGPMAVLAAVAGIAILRTPKEPPHTMRLTVPLPDKLVPIPSPPVISPDGLHLAFFANGGGTTRIWLRDLDGTAPRPLDETAGVFQTSGIAWSPDSRYLAYFADSKLKKLPIGGGPAVALCNTSNNPRGVSWGAKDTLVFAPALGTGLMRVPSAGGTPIVLTELDTVHRENSHRWPWFLPDGRHFLFLDRNSAADQSAIWVGDLESKARKKLVATLSSAAFDPRGYLLVLRDRILLAQPFNARSLELSGETAPIAQDVDFNASPYNVADFSVSATGLLAYYSGGSYSSVQLTWCTRNGQTAGTAGTAFSGNWARLSPDGRLVASDRTDPQSPARYDIWINDLVRGTESKLTIDGRDCVDPVWSPDSKHLAYEVREPGHSAIYVRPADGSGREERVTDFAPTISPDSWSRDGRYLFYHRIDTGRKPDIWVLENPLDAAGRSARAVIAGDPAETTATLSPDGKWLAYVSDQNSQVAVYVEGFGSQSGHWQVSPGNGDRPTWSHDGKELFYMDAEGQIMAVEVSSGSTFQFSQPHPLFRTRMARSLDLSPDGKRFLMLDSTADASTATLNLVLNWSANLK